MTVARLAIFAPSCCGQAATAAIDALVNDDAVANREIAHRTAHVNDRAAKLVTENLRLFAEWNTASRRIEVVICFAFVDVKISAT